MQLRHLYVEDTGRGDPLLLVHGLLGSARYWDGAMGVVGDGRRVVRPELLGFGRSPWPDVDYTMDLHLEALSRAVMPRLFGGFDLVGHSFGSMLALELAARIPERVRSLTLLALPYYDDDAQARDYVARDRWGRWVIETPRFARALCACFCEHRDLWRHVLPHFLRKFPRHVVEDGMLHSYRSVATTLEHCVIGHRVDAAADAVRRAGIDVRVVAGKDDPVAPPERARVFARRFGRGVEVIEGDHAFPLSDHSWLSSTDAARRGALHRRSASRRLQTASSPA